MANFENVRMINVAVNVATGTAAALVDRFVTIDSNGRAITMVPGATGGIPAGILSAEVDTSTNGVKFTSMTLAGCRSSVLLGENCTRGAPLRVGGNGGETDGAAYLANASNDVIVGWADEAGTAGEFITIIFVGYAGLAA